MRNIIIYFIFILFCTGIMSCSGGGGDKTAPVAEDSILQDSLGKAISQDTIKEEEPPKPDLSTTEAQINHMKESGTWDQYETGILPQMAEDAPEYCREILENDGKRFIVVDKAKMKLFLYDGYGNIEKSYGIACAKNYGTKHKKGDSRTTEGIFNVKGVFDSTEWLFTNDNGYTSPVKGQYGPRFIRLDIPYIGIHGTGSPGSIGRRCSHGCIRVTNPNILELVEFVEEGMKVIISPGPRDIAVNEKEGYTVLAVATEPGDSPAVAGKASVTSSPRQETKKEDTTEVGSSENEETKVAEPEIESPEATEPQSATEPASPDTQE